jgi:hypothetical protein
MEVHEFMMKLFNKRVNVLIKEGIKIFDEDQLLHNFPFLDYDLLRTKLILLISLVPLPTHVVLYRAITRSEALECMKVFFDCIQGVWGIR